MGLEEAGMHVDWVAGVSIGALNAALIAGNPPGRRIERLREFWSYGRPGKATCAMRSPIPSGDG
jgi:NTE family protein